MTLCGLGLDTLRLGSGCFLACLAPRLELTSGCQAGNRSGNWNGNRHGNIYIEELGVWYLYSDSARTQTVLMPFCKQQTGSGRGRLGTSNGWLSR